MPSPSQVRAAFPELNSEVLMPHVIGTQRLPKSILHTMRKQQLVDLAAAYDVLDQIDKDGTKDEILPVMIALEKAGRLKGCKRPYRLLKASKSADEWQRFRDDGGKIPNEADIPDKDMSAMPARELDPNSFKGLQQRCKDAGIARFGMTKEMMIEALALHEMGLATPVAQPQPAVE